MDKFLEWIVKKGYWHWYPYDRLPFIECKQIKFPQGYEVDGCIPKQMLIGYMQEYLILKGIISFRQFGKWLSNEISDFLLLEDSFIDNPTDIIYEILKEKIEG